MTGPALTLVQAKEWTSDDGRRHRRETWEIRGGEIDPAWRRIGPSDPDWVPTSRFTLYVVDGALDPRVSSYGGEVWPTAWPDLFDVPEVRGRGFVNLTARGCELRAAALSARAS